MIIDNFFSIGSEFITTPESNNIDGIASNDMVSINKKIDINTLDNVKTSDNRDYNKFSIICKPDESMLNPDTTGNGVATEAYNEHYDTENINIVKCKSQYNNLSNLFQYFRIICGKITDLFNISDENHVQLLHVMFNNVSKTNPTTNITYSLQQFRLADFDVIDEAIKIITSFKPYNEYSINETLKALSTLNINTFKSSLKTNTNIKFNDIFIDKSWEFIINLFAKIKSIYNNLIQIDNITEFYGKTSIIKTNIKKYDYETSVKLIRISSSFTRILSGFSTFFDTLYMILKQYLSYFSPQFETKIIINPNEMIYNVDKLNPYISSDYHLFKELLKGGDTEFEYTKNILTMHNSVVKPNDIFLFLGDLTESEYYDNNHPKILELVKKYANLMNGKKILLLGNNDTAPDEFYKSCGFTEIHHDPIMTKKFIFSHGPINTILNHINVHGHIHGNKQYWDIDFHNHIDCYFGLWGKPVRLLELTTPKKIDFYYNGCVTKDSSFIDPETQKEISNKIN